MNHSPTMKESHKILNTYISYNSPIILNFVFNIFAVYQYCLNIKNLMNYLNTAWQIPTHYFMTVLTIKKIEGSKV